MLELQGTSCKDCKVFTDNIEESALEIIYKLLSNPLFEKAKIRIMPDVHTGKGITIGFSCPISDFVNPSHVGVDIGCGVESIFFEKAIPEDKYAIFEHRVKKSIPLGMNQHSKTMFELKDFFKFLNSEIQKAYQTSKGAINFIQFKKEKDLEDWCSSRGVEYKTFLHSIGTLGGGELIATV